MSNHPLNIGTFDDFSQIVTEIAAQRFISNINPMLNSPEGDEIRVTPWTTSVDTVIDINPTWSRAISVEPHVSITRPADTPEPTAERATRTTGPRTPHGTGATAAADTDIHNVYFDIYKTLKHEVEDSEYIIGDESLFSTDDISNIGVAKSGNTVYDKEEELTILIIDFKQKLRRIANKLMETSIDYKKTKEKYEKNIKLIRTFIQLIDSDDDSTGSPTSANTPSGHEDDDQETAPTATSTNDTLSTKLKELIDDYIIKNYDEDKLYNKAKEIQKTRDEFMKYQSVANLIKSIQPVPICSICLDKIVDTVLVGCGHTCCSKCVNPLYNCHVCRKRIVKKQKIFL